MSDHAGRRGYDSDLTDAQWELVEPLLPPERGGRGWGRGGRRRRWNPDHLEPI